MFDLPEDVLTYMLSFLSIYDLMGMDNATCSRVNNSREYLHRAFKNLRLTPYYFQDVIPDTQHAWEMVTTPDNVFSQLNKGPYLYEHRYKWLQNRHIKVCMMFVMFYLFGNIRCRIIMIIHYVYIAALQCQVYSDE